MGFAMLVFFPLSMSWFVFSGDKRPAVASSLVVDRPSSSPDASTAPAHVISLAPLEPVISVQGDGAAPVSLRGILLPADPAEESSDGRH